MCKQVQVAFSLISQTARSRCTPVSVFPPGLHGLRARQIPILNDCHSKGHNTTILNGVVYSISCHLPAASLEPMTSVPICLHLLPNCVTLSHHQKIICKLKRWTNCGRKNRLSARWAEKLQYTLWIKKRKNIVHIKFWELPYQTIKWLLSSDDEEPGTWFWPGLVSNRN